MLVAVLALSALLQAQSAPRVAVSGVVQDQSGAVLQNATVELVAASGAVRSTTTTDAAGGFHFDNVAAGQYELRTSFEGFKPAAVRVRVGARAPAPQKLVLRLADVKQEITVSNAAAQVDATASNNLDAVTVDQQMLESLPVFDQDYIATLSRFLDSGSLGSGGATVVVNGMEVSALRVSASAVQQIKINQDPYSAEYARPGRGRIEILTKPGGQEYHGEGERHLPRRGLRCAERVCVDQTARTEAHRRGCVWRAGRDTAARRLFFFRGTTSATISRRSCSRSV